MRRRRREGVEREKEGIDLEELREEGGVNKENAIDIVVVLQQRVQCSACLLMNDVCVQFSCFF